MYKNNAFQQQHAYDYEMMSKLRGRRSLMKRAKCETTDIEEVGQLQYLNVTSHSHVTLEAVH